MHSSILKSTRSGAKGTIQLRITNLFGYNVINIYMYMDMDVYMCVCVREYESHLEFALFRQHLQALHQSFA